MTSLLVSELKKRIATGFKGRLLKGTLRREGGSALNALGDTSPVSAKTYAIGEMIRDDFSALYKAQSGIPDTDVKLLVLLGTVASNIVPKQDDKVYIKTPINKWYQVRKVLSIDPAGASAEMQAYEIPAP